MRCIDADKLYPDCMTKNGTLAISQSQIANAPTVDAIVNTIEVRSQGEWIKWNFKTFGALGDWEYKCSNCEKVYGGEYNFCPNCGSVMRKGGAE